MKKSMLLILVLGMALVSIPIYGLAADTRNASGTSITQNRSNFTNIAAMGQNVGGNPGYLVLAGTTVAGNNSFLPEWYLWVDADNDLCMASAPTIANESEFPDGNWYNFNSGTCTKVGGQS